MTIRNDQIGVNARSIDDVVALDQAVLSMIQAHETARAWVESLSNSMVEFPNTDIPYAV